MKNIFTKKLIDKIFDLVILMKTFFGFFEVLSGIVLAFSGRMMTSNLIIALTQQEILEDPKDFFSNFLIQSANTFSYGSHTYAIFYLISHGVINIYLAIVLLKNKIWIYPWAMAVFGSFIIYQTYRYFHTYSLLLLFLTLFDILVVLVIWLEYRKNK